MDSIALKSDLCCDAIVIPGTVVNRMIAEANEAQLKIYLYLLKTGSNANTTVASLADYFNYTEADVIRALNFWNGSGNGGDNVVAFSARPSYSKDKLALFAGEPGVAQLLFAAEQYMARPLSTEDISSFMYMYEEMGFSAELIEYLIEYCISNNKKTARSIEAVAAEWKDMNVVTLDDAKRLTRQVPSVMPEVFAAFGIDKNHQPIDAEITYVRRWTESYGYGMDIIKEACQRTVMTAGRPSFRYANSIIKGWHEAKVQTVADILTADEQYRMNKVNSSNTSTTGSQRTVSNNKTDNKFRNFNEREYDYESLMKDILSN